MWKKVFWLFLTLIGFGLQNYADEQATPAPTKKVLWVPFNGTVELGLAPFIQRAIQTAEASSYDRVILEVETFGGRVDAAVVIRDALLASKVKTVAWIHNRAISAGALVSLATDEIYFAPGSSMGAATPVQVGQEGAQDVSKKYVSYFRGEMGSTAEAKGRSRKIAEAMVQATETIPGLVKEGDVLTLTDTSALEHKISNGTVKNREELLQKLDLIGAQVDTFEINWAEKIVRFLTDPVVSGLLMSLGVLGILFELQSPGFGAPGILGALCFAAFFGAKFLVHLAGWEELILLIIGIGFLITELFILPGFIIFGVLGFVSILAALFFAGIGENIPLDINIPEVAQHLRGLSIAFLVTAVGLIVIGYWIMKNPSRMPLVLKTALPAGGAEPSNTPPVGAQGQLTTDLRPSGKANFENKIFDVETEGEFLTRGVKVEIIRKEGHRLWVRRVG